MEPNVDRGMWSVVVLLAAIVIGGVVLIAFPKISGKIVNSMDVAVRDIFVGKNPDWVNGQKNKLEIEKQEKLLLELISPENIIKASSGIDVFPMLTPSYGYSLTHTGTRYFIDGSDTFDKYQWHWVSAKSDYADYMYQIIDVRGLTKGKIIFEGVIDKPYLSGHGKVVGLDGDLVFKELIIKKTQPTKPHIEEFELNGASYIIAQLPAPQSPQQLIFE